GRKVSSGVGFDSAAKQTIVASRHRRCRSDGQNLGITRGYALADLNGLIVSRSDHHNDTEVIESSDCSAQRRVVVQCPIATETHVHDADTWIDDGVVIEHPIHSGHDRRIRSCSGLIEYLYAVWPRVWRNTHHIDAVVQSGQNAGDVRPMTVIVLARTADGSKPLRCGCEIPMSKIDAGI